MKKIMSAISIILSIILIVLLVLLNIIPNKYLLIIIGGLFISNLISILLIFRKNKFLKVIGYLFISIVIIGSLIGIYYTGNTTKLFNSIREVKEKNIYYVVVNKDSEYDKLENLKDKKIGTIKSDSTNYKKALKDIEKTIKISNKDYESTLTLFNDVIDNKIDSILISSNNYEIACESNENIKNNTKVIYQVSIEVIKEKEKEYNNSKGTMNILISGIDTNGDINKENQLLLRISLLEKQIEELSKEGKDDLRKINEKQRIKIDQLKKEIQQKNEMINKLTIQLFNNQKYE